MPQGDNDKYTDRRNRKGGASQDRSAAVKNGWETRRKRGTAA